MKNKIQIIGNGKTSVFVISQALPIWPQITLYERCFANLKKYCTFYVYDALMEIDDKTQRKNFLNFWKAKIKESGMNICLGFSLGGVILQYLLNEPAFKDFRFITISTPTYIHHDMLRKLKNMMILLENNEIDLAVENLASLVKTKYDKGVLYPVYPHQREWIKRRLYNGFRLLIDHDAREEIGSFKGKLLSMIGEGSKLVHVNSAGANPLGELKVIPGSGMRILVDNNVLCSRYILDFLGISQEVTAC